MSSGWIVKVHCDGRVVKETEVRHSEGAVRKIIAKDIAGSGWGTWQEGQRFSRRAKIPGVNGFKPGRFYEVTHDV